MIALGARVRKVERRTPSIRISSPGERWDSRRRPARTTLARGTGDWSLTSAGRRGRGFSLRTGAACTWGACAASGFATTGTTRRGASANGDAARGIAQPSATHAHRCGVVRVSASTDPRRIAIEPAVCTAQWRFGTAITACAALGRVIDIGTNVLGRSRIVSASRGVRSR